jgi:hypothetical protein
MITTIGYLLVALLIAGLALEALLALTHGRPFYGVNYWGAPVGTYSTFAILVVIGAAGVARLVKLVITRRDRKSG